MLNKNNTIIAFYYGTNLYGDFRKMIQSEVEFCDDMGIPYITYVENNVNYHNGAKHTDEYEYIFHRKPLLFPYLDETKSISKLNLKDVNFWFNHIDVGRSIKHINQWKLTSMLGKHVFEKEKFVKTVDKGISTIFKKGQVLYPDYDTFSYFDKTSFGNGIIISDVIDLKDIPISVSGKHEVRIFVFDGYPVSIGFSHNNTYLVKTDLYWKDILPHMLKCKKHYKNYVLDIALDKNDKTHIIELNDIETSGRYVSHSPLDLFRIFFERTRL